MPESNPHAIEIPRNPGIDILRGLSIVLVVMHHLGLRIPLRHGVLSTILPKRFLDGLIYNGYEAVFIFFVISGFLIALHTIRRWGGLSSIRLAAFYRRRAARILPCLAILIAVLSLLHLASIKDYAITHSNQSLPQAIFSAIGLYLNWYEGHTGYLPGGWDVLWSLSIEEVFYLAFPLACLLLRRNWILVPSLLLLALSLPITRAAISGNEIWREKAYLPGMAAIATGILGAMLAAKFQPRESALARALRCLGTCGLISILFFEDKIWHLLGNGTMLLLIGSALFLLLGFEWQSVPTACWVMTSTAWLRSFGRQSYEIYLTHMFVVFAIVNIYKHYAKTPWWGILWYIPALALSWIIGWLVARFISNPCAKAISRQ